MLAACAMSSFEDMVASSVAANGAVARDMEV